MTNSITSERLDDLEWRARGSVGPDGTPANTPSMSEILQLVAALREARACCLALERYLTHQGSCPRYFWQTYKRGAQPACACGLEQAWQKAIGGEA